MADRFRGRLGDERQEGQRIAVARLEFGLVALAHLGDLGHVGLVDRGDVRRNALAHHHVLGDALPHHAHRFHAGARGFGAGHGELVEEPAEPPVCKRSGVTGVVVATAVGGALAWAMVRAPCADMYASRSCLVMRPPAPVPRTCFRSMPYSRAILRTSGDKRTSGRFSFHRRRGLFHRNRIRTGGMRHGLGQRLGLERGLSPRPREALELVSALEARRSSFRRRGRWSRRPISRAFFDPAHHRADRHRLAFFHQHFFQHAGRGRRNLGVHFVGRNLKQRLIAIHVLPGLLQPLGQGAFHDAFAHLGHYYVSHEYVSVYETHRFHVTVAAQYRSVEIGAQS